MGVDDAARWDGRYSDHATPVVPSPPDAFADAELIERVPTVGTALDIACGLGAQTVWLAQRGLHVTSLDVSGEAVRRVDAAARSQRMADRVSVRVADLDDGLPGDLGVFDMVVCQRFRDPMIYASMVAHLRPGGLLVVTVLSRTGATNPGAFHAPGGELRASFDRDDCTVLHHREADGQESIIVERTR